MPHDSLSFMMPGLNYQIVELNFQKYLICQYVHLEPPCLSEICDCVSTDFWINFGQQVTTWHRHLGGLIQWCLRPVTGHWRLPRRHLRHPIKGHLGCPALSFEAPWASMPRWASRPVASESEASSELPPGSSMMYSRKSPQEPEPEPEQ